MVSFSQSKKASSKLPKVGLIISMAVILFLIAWYTNIVNDSQSFIVTGSSMSPTLVANQRLIATKRVTDPQRNDLVIFRNSTGTPSITRVVALGGDRVVIANGNVRAYNSKGVEVTGIYDGGTTSGSVDVTVPAGKLYVLGDNRQAANDSRNIGPIDRDAVIGNIVKICKVGQTICLPVT